MTAKVSADNQGFLMPTASLAEQCIQSIVEQAFPASVSILREITKLTEIVMDDNTVQ